MGRRLDMEAVLPGGGFYSPGEGLAVRRGEQGHWLISSDDGQCFLFEADPHHPQRQRLKMLGDRNSNCLNLYYDDRGRIVEISGEQQRPCIRLYYELAAHPRRVTQIYQHFPETAPLLLRRYSYDEAGHLNGVYDSTGHLLREFAYDENHCMTLHRQPGGEGYYYQWGWYEGPDDAAWRVTGHHTDSGEQYRLAWDLAQRRLCVTDGLGRTRYHQWDAQNQVTAYQDEAGQVTTFRWSDEERLLLGMTDPQGGKWRYVYDLQGHITETHDPLGRVEQAQWHPVWHQPETEVDAAGNLLGRRAGERATAENSVVPFNRLMSYRGVHYRYDEFGRAVEKEGRSGTQSYRYDAEHRMVEVTTARGTYRYVYDALGRRTEKQHISPDGKPYNRTKFLWDGMRLAQESRPEGTGSLYIYRDQGSYEPLARVDKAGKEGPNRILYFHTDVNGAPEEMTDSDGKIVWETGYQVWGNTIQEKDHGGVEQNLRYQGQYLDRETGLHYNLHRYYDPDVGRFMVTDPIGLRGGLNLYSYAPNPLKYADPLGLTPCAVSNQKANRLLDSSETKVTVRSRSDAEQLFMDRYLGHNYKNMTGESGPSTKNLMEYLTENKTKAGSYHWDDIKDPSVTKPSYRVSGHGPGNPDGDLPHLQVHQHGGSVRHIFFPWET
ncbi:RHS repeat domain-containing protein [Shigella flexneri]|nr:RHS repeat-associated core domain-containing protein [Shigella flexneri]